VIGPPEV